MRAPTTWLYVPADRPDRIARALATNADVVIVDLEDAVVPDRKAVARKHADEALRAAAAAGRAVQLRVNAEGTPWAEADLELVATLPLEVGVRLPKCAEPAVVRAVAGRLPGRAVHLLVESALGVERAHDLARAASTVASIGLGEADLRADLGVAGDEGLQYARGRLVVVAAAAGLPSPSMSVYPDVRDLDGLRASCAVGRAMGFLGRTAVHPRQLDVIRDAFTPSESEVAQARQLLAAAEAGAADHRGAVALPDGRFVDEAVLRQARRVLDLASDDRG